MLGILNLRIHLPGDNMEKQVERRPKSGLESTPTKEEDPAKEGGRVKSKKWTRGL